MNCWFLRGRRLFLIAPRSGTFYPGIDACQKGNVRTLQIIHARWGLTSSILSTKAGNYRIATQKAETIANIIAFLEGNRMVGMKQLEFIL